MLSELKEEGVNLLLRAEALTKVRPTLPECRSCATRGATGIAKTTYGFRHTN